MQALSVSARSLCGSLFALLFGMAVAAAGPVVPTPEVRLLVAGTNDAGYEVGLAIGLPPDWHTYWRYPGEAGLPPVISTEGSRNLEKLVIAWPAPSRHYDGYASSIVYPGGVVLPITVVPVDPAVPVSLSIDLFFGFCDMICVPGHARLDKLLLPGARGDEAGRAAVAAARAAVPRAEAPGVHPAILGVSRLAPGEGPPVLAIETTPAPGGGPVDLFAVGPEGWALPLPQPDPSAPGRFLLALRGLPKGTDPAGGAITLVAVQDGRATEAERRVP
ncbi:protein-disulfide reductase DsbD domain-containing protein [Methylobrevis albus]|uniref:Thiol:disulfide interchange protein DsbD N-terminal domain-containing protein n=1 Tax=Methylobrevis albus TaxID=2793297 RepID=A0A931I2P8_9HYPH|nr:protein-disulfide reductase DsbD domain-containing protein [Methylobrevis albus]MBH0238171.1 hypothetical protein [Methylobrevis albus]